MKLLKLMAVENVQAGDLLILGESRFGVFFIEEEPHGRNFYLKATDGSGVSHFVSHGEKVPVEL